MTPIIFILGPTAGGKSALAIELARLVAGGGEIISADSMQIYKGLNIGTAKPTTKEQRNIPHHLIDFISPTSSFDVNTWKKVAEKSIELIRSKNKWPIIAGGTSLYAQAILRGLDPLPKINEKTKNRLDNMTSEEIRDQLLKLDSESAELLHPNDKRRIKRAVEISLSAGEPASALRNAWSRHEIRKDAILIGLDWETTNINKRINQRVKKMMLDGLLEETKNLYDAKQLGTQASAALGYAQLINHLEGNSSLEDSIEQIKIRTRRLAKQQRTWFSKFKARKRCHWLKADHKTTETLAKEALRMIEKDLNCKDYP